MLIDCKAIGVMLERTSRRAECRSLGWRTTVPRTASTRRTFAPNWRPRYLPALVFFSSLLSLPSS